MSNTTGCDCQGILISKVFLTQYFSHLSAEIWLQGSLNSHANSNSTVNVLQEFRPGSHWYVTRHITKTLWINCTISAPERIGVLLTCFSETDREHIPRSLTGCCL